MTSQPHDIFQHTFIYRTSIAEDKPMKKEERKFDALIRNKYIKCCNRNLTTYSYYIAGVHLSTFAQLKDTQVSITRFSINFIHRHLALLFQIIPWLFHYVSMLSKQRCMFSFYITMLYHENTLSTFNSELR